MSISVSYMGTKRHLAGIISQIAKEHKPGPFLDLFSGLSTVACKTVSSRDVWLNDISPFGYAVSQALFTRYPSNDFLPEASILKSDVEFNLSRSSEPYSKLIQHEREVYESNDSDFYNNLVDIFPYYKRDEFLYSSWVDSPSKPQFDLMTTGYSGTYFGLTQCLEIDAIRECIESRRPTVDEHTYKFLLVALCIACSKTSTSPGHFAQFLTANKNNIKRLTQQRRRSVVSEFFRSFQEIALFRTTLRYGDHISFQGEANATLDQISKMRIMPGVIYADPPYTSDHYSRYYHILDTLVDYVKRPLNSKGRYPEDRFVSNFSVKSKVEDALQHLIQKARILRSDILISYPSNGLLPGGVERIGLMLKQNFSNTKQFQLDHFHSSMGASKGKSRSPVVEHLLCGFN